LAGSEQIEVSHLAEALQYRRQTAFAWRSCRTYGASIAVSLYAWEQDVRGGGQGRVDAAVRPLRDLPAAE